MLYAMAHSIRHQMVHEQVTFKRYILHHIYLVYHYLTNIINNLLIIIVTFTLNSNFEYGVFVFE